MSSSFWIYVFIISSFLCNVNSLDNGVALTPPMGWSTWNTFGCSISEDLIKSSAKVMASTIKQAGYQYILLDDCWSHCLVRNSTNNKCQTLAPRDQQGRIPPDPDRFPSGLRSLSDYVHSLSLKIGIYTAVSALTCQGYHGSLGYEDVDADTFVNVWNFDFVKHDTCNTDCGVHDSCIQNSTSKMSQAIQRTGKDVVYYIDSGNPTSPSRVYNPEFRRVRDVEMVKKVASKPTELAYIWAMPIAHMVKSWFDIGDSWSSMLSNVHNSIHTEYYQQCGAYHFPDMLTVGMGGQSESQYRVQFYLWAILGAPLILGNDIRSMSASTIALLTATDVIEIAQDPLCYMGSVVSQLDSTEVWVKLLSSKSSASSNSTSADSSASFAVVFVNKDSVYAKNVTLDLSGWTDLYPVASFEDVTVRAVNVGEGGHDMGVYKGEMTVLVQPMDAIMAKITIV